MDETAFRILDTLSRGPGEQLSIRGLTRAIRSLHGTAHYANTYHAARKLQREGSLRFARGGNAQLVSLGLGSPPAINALAEMELTKRRLLFQRLKTLRHAFESLSELPAFGPVSLIDPERNANLNRVELLLCLPAGLAPGREPEGLFRELHALERKLNIRIDALALSESDFRALLAARDRNPLKEMLSRQTVLLGPDLFWFLIWRAWAQGIEIHFDRGETNPAKIPEGQILHNLTRFGYEEFGQRPEGGEDLGIEFLAIALLLKRDARLKAAAAVLLAKNRASYPVLLFLSRKHGVEAETLGLLEAVDRLRPEAGRRAAIRALAERGVVAVPADGRHIERTMRTYDAV